MLSTPGSYIFGTVVILMAQSGIITLLLVQARRRRQAEEHVRRDQAKLRASYEHTRNLGRQLLRAQEAERARVGRELHDDVGQQLTLLAIDLELILGAGPDLERETGTLIYETLTRTRAIVKKVHDLSHRLHPEKLHLLGLVAALSGIGREFSPEGLQLTFSHHNVPDSLRHDVSLCLFRIAQEVLQNIVQHGAAREASLKLIGTEAGLILTIVDDGTGFEGETSKNTGKNSGRGLISMRERLDAIGGSLKISTGPAGTRLEITVPEDCLVTIPA